MIDLNRINEEITSKGTQELFIWSIISLLGPIMYAIYLPWYYILPTLATSIMFPILVANTNYYKKISYSFTRGGFFRVLFTCPKCLAFWSTLFIIYPIHLWPLLNGTDLITFINGEWLHHITAALHPVTSAAYAYIIFIVLSISMSKSQPLPCCGK